MNKENYQRQHIAIACIESIENFFKYILPYLLVRSFNYNPETDSLASNWPLFVFISWAIGLSIIHWWSITYRINSQGNLLIQSGILTRRKREVDPARVQLVDIQANLLHQLFRVVSLKIETAGGQGDAEVHFKALKLKDANQLKTHLTGELTQETSITKEHTGLNNTTIFSSSITSLLVFAATSGSVGYLWAFSVPLLEILPEDYTYGLAAPFVQDIISNNSIATGIVIGCFLFVLSWILSIAVETIRHAGFHVYKLEQKLVVEYGIISRQSYTISPTEVRAIFIKENFARRILGLATVYIEINCGKGKGQREVKLLLPIVARQKIARYTRQLIDIVPTDNISYEAPPRRSIHRYILRSLLSWMTVFGILYLYISSEFTILYLETIAMLFALGGITSGILRWKYSGIALLHDALAVRSGALTLNTSIIPKSRILCITHKAHLFQRIARVCSIHILLPTGAGTRLFKHGCNSTAKKTAIWFKKSSNLAYQSQDD